MRSTNATVNTGYRPSYSRRRRIDERDRTAREQPARDETHAHLDDEESNEIGESAARPLDERNHADRQEDGRWIVAAGLQLEQMAQPWNDCHPSGPENREDGGSVGRGDDRSEQHAFQQFQSKDPRRDRAKNDRTEQDADSGQRHPRYEHPPDVAPRGPGAAAEQDERQRDNSVTLREFEVFELNAEQPFRSSEHPEDEEEEQARHAEPRGGLAQENTRKQESGSQKDERVRAQHGWLVPPPLSMGDFTL